MGSKSTKMINVKANKQSGKTGSKKIKKGY